MSHSEMAIIRRPIRTTNAIKEARTEYRKGGREDEPADA